ncbi:O-antigen ligase family protein [Salinibacter sp.]|uniref:O-antigen ligase family protein n=1 Tax=Salinibacter sp. TaxID=2065818 RepID=UPI003D74B12E
MWEIVTQNHLRVSRFRGSTLPVPTGPFVNNAGLSVSLALIYPFSLLSLVRSNSYIYKSCLSVCLLLVPIIIIFTGAKGVYLSVVLQIAFVATLLLHLSIESKTKIIIKILCSVFLLISAVYLVVPILPSDIAEEMSRAKNLILEGDIGTNESRLQIIKNGFYYLGETWGLGLGPNGLYNQLRRNAEYNTYGTYNPHNFWISLLSNYGIVVFSSFIIWLSRLFIFFVKNAVAGKYEITKYYNIAPATAIVALPLGLVSPSNVVNLKTLWLIFGVLAVYKYKSLSGLN